MVDWIDAHLSPALDWLFGVAGNSPSTERLNAKEFDVSRVGIVESALRAVSSARTKNEFLVLLLRGCCFPKWFSKNKILSNNF